jgi:hypothetical protein
MLRNPRNGIRNCMKNVLTIYFEIYYGIYVVLSLWNPYPDMKDSIYRRSHAFVLFCYALNFLLDSKFIY